MITNKVKSLLFMLLTCAASIVFSQPQMNFKYDESVLIGWKYPNGKYKFDVPANLADCGQDVEKKIWDASPKATEGQGFSSMEPVPVWMGTNFAPYVSADSLQIMTPKPIKDLAKSAWNLISSGVKKSELTFIAGVQGSANHRPCWVLLTKDWLAFEKLPSHGSKAGFVIAVTDKEQTDTKLFKAKTLPFFGDEKMPALIQKKFEQIVLSNKQLLNQVAKFVDLPNNVSLFNSLNKEQAKLVQYHEFRAGINGKNETFLHASIYGRAGQATMTLNLTRNQVCRWQEGGEGSVHGQTLLGVFDRFKQGTDEWLVAEYFYEGSNLAVIKPVLIGKSCEFKYVTITGYSGL